MLFFVIYCCGSVMFKWLESIVPGPQEKHYLRTGDFLWGRDQNLNEVSPVNMKVKFQRP